MKHANKVQLDINLIVAAEFDFVNKKLNDIKIQ